MSLPDAKPEDLTRPIKKPSRTYMLLGAVASVAVLIFLVGWTIQLQEGLEVTNLSDWGSGGGVTWGTYIGTFVWWVGIAHGGIIVSAAVRLFKLEKYEPVARIAELLTLGALSMAGLMIVVHLGRPDRIVWSVIKAYPTTVHTSPLAWDLTVITLYFVLTATYIALTLRSDIYQLRDQLPDILDPLYSALLFSYDPSEDEVVERMAWWLALAIIVLAPLLLHGGVIPWLFALTASTPGWFGGLTAPQFLSAALASAMGGILVVMYAFRWAYDWDAVLPDRVFWGIGWWMGFFSLMIVWLQLQKILTGSYGAAPLGVETVTDATIVNPVYYAGMLLIIIPLAYVAFQHFGIIRFSRRGMAIAGIAVVLGVEIDKTLFVVEGLLYPATRLYGNVPGAYTPTWIELSTILGTTGLVVLYFMLVSKIIPIVELNAVEHEGEDNISGPTYGTEPEGGD